MPKAASKSRSSGPQSATRSAPYPSPKPKANDTAALTDKSATSLNAAAAKQTSPNPPSSPSTKPKPSSFLDLELSGESDHTVPVYDTCTIIRTKINNLISKDHKPENAIPNESTKNGQPKYWTGRAFADALGDGVTERMFRTFMSKNGVMAGAETEVFYKAYCFFEKKRIWEGKPKSAARKKAEAEHTHGLCLFDPAKPRPLLKILKRGGRRFGRDIPYPPDPRSCGNCGKH